MKASDINIRDPFVLYENGVYYMYGTRAENFGKLTSGFDVYTSENLTTWSKPAECFNSTEYKMNSEVNWAPEVHKYKGKYYMLATFTSNNGLRGTYVLKSDTPSGPFTPHSNKQLTPADWECLDGTLYIDKNGSPYLVFCHEHTQIIDGTICYQRLNDDLTSAIGEPVTIFSGSSPYWADKKANGEHYITDGPFMYRTEKGRLLMIWSTSVNGKYCQCVARSDNDDITGYFEHLPLLVSSDGGHGMIFNADGQLMLTLHTPNKTNYERPVFIPITDVGDNIMLK